MAHNVLWAAGMSTLIDRILIRQKALTLIVLFGAFVLASTLAASILSLLQTPL